MSLESKTLIETALREHEPKLRLYVHARAQFADIDDILQIAAMRAIENANKLRDSEKVLAWLYRIQIVDIQLYFRWWISAVHLCEKRPKSWVLQSILRRYAFTGHAQR